MNLFSYFTVKDHGDEYSAYYTYNAAGETAYYHAITFLWPFKLLPAFYGALEIAFFALVALGQATVALSFIWLGDRLLTQKISGGSDVERSLEAAWEKFRGQKRQLEAADEQAASHIERLRAALAQGQLETTNAERQQLAEALAFFADHERRLEEMRELLDIYTHIHSARLNTDADRQAVRHGPSGHGPGCYRCGDRRE